nr:chromatin structure-remodeling complex protein BSH [Ipomoea batatas]
MKQLSAWSFTKAPVKFKIPTNDNLVPIRLDIEIDGQRLRDAFTWNPSDPDTEVVLFAKRTVKDLKLPPAFVTQIAQSIQSQLAEFRSYEGQEMFTGEKVVPIKLDLRVNHTLIKDQFLWDLNNFESDPEEFARNFCKDMGIEDPEVGPAIAIAIREQLYEVCVSVHQHSTCVFLQLSSRFLFICFLNLKRKKEIGAGKEKGKEIFLSPHLFAIFNQL